MRTVGCPARTSHSPNVTQAKLSHALRVIWLVTPLELPGVRDRPQCELHEGQALAGLPGRAAQRMEGGCFGPKEVHGLHPSKAAGANGSALLTLTCTTLCRLLDHAKDSCIASTTRQSWIHQDQAQQCATGTRGRLRGLRCLALCACGCAGVANSSKYNLHPHSNKTSGVVRKCGRPLLVSLRAYRDGSCDPVCRAAQSIRTVCVWGGCSAS